MNLFERIVPEERLHPIFRLLLEPENSPEREVLTSWATGFVDRDRKFVKEFQTTFESSFWELYLHAALKELRMDVDLSFHAPDFLISQPSPFVLEATITAPAIGAPPAFGPGPPELPSDLNAFNSAAILRLCNSVSSKLRKYRDQYSMLDHVRSLPFVIAIAPFDRPQPQLVSNRAIVATLYGTYFDEEATLEINSPSVVRYEMTSVQKTPTSDVPVGLFTDDRHHEVSAIVYGPSASWGKVRALADAPTKNSLFTTFHPSIGSLYPQVRRAPKATYSEHLLDGLYVFHNPYASIPLQREVFDHPRIAQFLAGDDGTLHTKVPDDFLLMRTVMTLSAQGTGR